MKNWEKHRERIAKATCIPEFLGMISDLYGDFQDYCLKKRKNRCEHSYMMCHDCFNKWLDQEVKND